MRWTHDLVPEGATLRVEAVAVPVPAGFGEVLRGEGGEPAHAPSYTTFFSHMQSGIEWYSTGTLGTGQGSGVTVSATNREPLWTSWGCKGLYGGGESGIRTHDTQKVYRFSRPALSSAQPSLRGVSYAYMGTL